jgi:hypothetical protein
MTSTLARSRRLLPTALAAVFAIAGCTGAAAPASQGPSQAAATATSTPTPRTTPRPTPVPTAQPTPTARPTAAPPATGATDPASALKIAAPYKLRSNPANPSLSASFELTIAGVHVTETITGREITKAGKLVGMVLVLQIKGVPMSAQVFEAGAQGAARNVGGTVTYSTISGVKVAMIKAPAGTFGMVMLHKNILMVIGTKAADTKPLLTEVIKANK